MAAPSELQTKRLSLRPVMPEDARAIRTIRSSKAVSQWWGVECVDSDWPMNQSETRSFSIWLSENIVGFIQCYENTDPPYRHAGIDLFLDGSVHGLGLGREAITRLVEHLVEDCGHHRIVIDPAAHNTRAIRCYRACGFREVGVMQMYERDREGDGWHDGLLMEYVVPANL